MKNKEIRIFGKCMSVPEDLPLPNSDHFVPDLEKERQNYA